MPDEFKPTWMPWNYAGGGVIRGRDEGMVAYLAGRMNDGNADVVGRWMAAVPELLQALEACAREFGALAHILSAETCRMTEAALAKARGEI